MSIENNLWYDIQGTTYQITTDGQVRNKKTGHTLSQYFNDRGYYMVTIKINGRNNPKRVHRLIALSFIPNPNNHPFINHKDGNKTNNAIDNLEWCDCMQNNRHAIALGLVDNSGENNGMALLKEDQVREIKKMLKDGLSQYKIASKFGVSRSAIMNIKNRNQWKHVLL